MEMTPESYGLTERKDRTDFTVAFFGTAAESSAADQRAIEDARILTRRIVDGGYRLATGGFDFGVMKAVTDEANSEIAKLNLNGGDLKTEDIISGFPTNDDSIPVVRGATIERAANPTERLVSLVERSDCFIVFGGKFGTVAELIASMNSEKSNKGSKKPIIIVDSSLAQSDLLSYLALHDQKLGQSQLMDNIYIVNDADNAVIDDIVGAHYSEKNGQEIDDASCESLSRYSARQFLRAQREFGDGGGI
jgi:predicted Rossmann-fold nucleotide-binding protein